MNSYQIIDSCDNNVSNINNASQCSGDLFQESPQLECHNSFTNDIKFSNEKSSATSDELCFSHLGKPQRALSFSHDSLPNDSIPNSSKFFLPISPVNKINSVGSNSSLEVNQTSSAELFRKPGVHNLSKENVAGISFVSESEQSDSSSILDDSLRSENDHLNSKQFYRTPICSSVKKRTIRQWLSTVSLNSSLKPNDNGSHDQPEVIPPASNIVTYNSDRESTSEDVSIPLSDDDNKSHIEIYNSKEHRSINVADGKNSFDNGKIKKSSSNDCPWLFDTFENKRNEYSMKQYEGCHIDENHEHSNDVRDESTYNPSHKSPNKSVSFNNNSMGISLNKESEKNISRKGNHSLSFKKSKLKHKSDKSNFSSTDDNYSTFDEICNRYNQNNEDSDDSFTKIRSVRKKKKKNILNISSDESEAKDTANESEDIHHLNNDLCTPRRKLYFRNPLNNSLDDDAKPLTICNDYSINSKDHNRFIENTVDKSRGLLDQICMDVHNMNNTSVASHENEDNSKSEFGEGVKPGPCSLDESPSQHFNQSLVSVSCNQSSFNRHSSSGKPDDFSQINFSRLSIHDTSVKNISDNDDNIHLNSSDKDGCKSFSDIKNEPEINVDPNSSNRLPDKFEDSSDSIVNIKRKSKKNKLNLSSDDSFHSEKPNSIIIDVNDILDNKTNPLIDLTKSDDEYDKYMYRTRSDSSFSDYEGIPGVSKDSSEVISVHTTTSEEEDEENAPWFDLESYLKKNIPASSKDFDSSFTKNLEKRKARLSKIILPTHSSCPNHTSFLLSLTPDVPDEMCHPGAVKYRGESFSKQKNELVDLLFKLFNKDIFDDKLPPLEIKWSGHLTTTSGITKSSSKITKNGKIRNSMIKLSKTVVDDASKLRDVLLHELCHAANWLIDEQAGGHGPLFKKWVDKIWMKYPEVPKVRTTHHYELKWKYLYKCSYCGYELGKMKLSLNETSCRLCGGLVTVNS